MTFDMNALTCPACDVELRPAATIDNEARMDVLIGLAESAMTELGAHYAAQHPDRVLMVDLMSGEWMDDVMFTREVET